MQTGRMIHSSVLHLSYHPECASQELNESEYTLSSVFWQVIDKVISSVFLSKSQPEEEDVTHFQSNIFLDNVNHPVHWDDYMQEIHIF